MFCLTQTVVKLYKMETKNIDFIKQVSDKIENNIKPSNKKEETVKEEVLGTNTQSKKIDKDRSKNLKKQKDRKHGNMKNKVEAKKMDKEIKKDGHHTVDKIGYRIKSKKLQAKNIKKNVKKTRGK